MILSRTDLQDKHPELHVGDVINSPIGNKDEFYMVISGNCGYGILNLSSGAIQYLGRDSGADIKLFEGSLDELAEYLGTYTKVSGNFNAYIGE